MPEPLPPSIGPFQIERELGRGGMGIVFLARDTRLDRQVAIKSLPPDLFTDATRLERFRREAKTLASLNHANIAAIYGLEESSGQQHLVLEYVEGETLAQRLAGGALPVDEALSLARQIAEALEAAHEKGIVHRDLKPGNVMLTAAGRVKVLDFGLARTPELLSSSIEPTSADSPTVASPGPFSPTIPGVIMGTAGYMSPEQARGKAVDKRSDIFSFGCVLYEMLTGARAFAGETVSDSLAATLHREPDLGLLPAQTPREVGRLLRRCLVKDRNKRVHDIADARLELELAGTEQEVVAVGVPARRRLSTGIVAGALGMGVLLVGGTWLAASRLAARPAPVAAAVKLVIPSRTSTYRRASSPVISPDGRSIVFSAWPSEGSQPCLFVRALDSFEARRLADTDGGRGVFWSWDGRSIAFHADGKLWAVEVAASGSRRLIAAEPANIGADWSPRGDIILSRFGGEVRLVEIPAGGGAASPLTNIAPGSTEKVYAFPRFLPDGERYLFLGVGFDPESEVRTGKLYASRLGSSDRTLVGNILSPAFYVETGWLVYVQDGTIKAAPFDARSLQIEGEAVTISDGVSYFKAYGASDLSVARNGTLVFVPPSDQERLVWFDDAGRRLDTLGPRAMFSRPGISPDGSQVVVAVSDRRTQTSDLWLYGTQRPTATRLTSDARWESAPLFARDGSRVYFSWDRNDVPEIFSIRSDGTGTIEKVYGTGKEYGDADPGVVWTADDVSPDGSTLLVEGTVAKLGQDMRLVSLHRKGEVVPFRSAPANEGLGRFSPDGRFVAYVSDESGITEVYIGPFPGPGPKVQVSEGGGTRPKWSPKGDKLYFRSRLPGGGPAEAGGSGPSTLSVVDLDRPEAFRSPPKPRVLIESEETIRDFDVAQDGKRFLLQLQPLDTPPMHVIMGGLPARR